MNKNQFYYKRTEEKTLPGGEKKTEEFEDSFDLNRVIRTVEWEKGKRLILLDDIHERLQESPQMDSKGKIVGRTKQRNTFQSEIYLSPEDNLRYMQVTGNSFTLVPVMDHELGS